MLRFATLIKNEWKSRSCPPAASTFAGPRQYPWIGSWDSTEILLIPTPSDHFVFLRGSMAGSHDSFALALEPLGPVGVSSPFSKSF